MSAIFLLPVCLTYWPRKYTTHVDPHVDNSHQVWSWYDHTLPSYSIFVCWYVTWLCDLDFWPWTVAVHGGSGDQPCYQFWRSYAYQFLIYESTPTLIIPTKFEVDTCVHCRVIAFLSAVTSSDLDLWPWTVAVHGGSRNQHCHEVRRPHMPIRSWLMWYNVSHWLPLKRVRIKPTVIRDCHGGHI